MHIIGTFWVLVLLNTSGHMLVMPISYDTKAGCETDFIRLQHKVRKLFRHKCDPVSQAEQISLPGVIALDRAERK